MTEQLQNLLWPTIAIVVIFLIAMILDELRKLVRVVTQIRVHLFCERHKLKNGFYPNDDPIRDYADESFQAIFRPTAGDQNVDQE